MGMDHVAHAIEALRQTETSLRDLVSKAVAAGDYPGVVQIASWASTISELVKSCGEETNRRPVVAAVPRKASRSTGGAFAPRGLLARQTTSQNGYPRFFRRGAQLVRVAWSKRDKKEYQHKASHAVVQGVADAMAKVGGDGRVFSTEDFLPVDDADGNRVPSYQAYVCLALLKQTRLIDQHGRQGYSIPRLAEFKDAVESVWRKLPEYKPEAT